MPRLRASAAAFSTRRNPRRPIIVIPLTQGEIVMTVEMNHVHLPRCRPKAAKNRKGDRMIAAEHDRHRSPPDDRGDGGRDALPRDGGRSGWYRKVPGVHQPDAGEDARP